MLEAAPRQNILIAWIFWQFFEAPKNILKAWRNFLLFNLNYFSIPLLIKTFFSHWRRYEWSYGRGFDLRRWAFTCASNLISRVLGAMMRSILIFVGLFIQVFIFLVGIVIFFSWLLLPVLIILGFSLSFRVLF